MNKEEYLLTCVAEECAEIAKAACKALRFGLDDCAPGTTTTNAEHIKGEVRDLMAVIGMLQDMGSLPKQTLEENLRAAIAKREKVERFMQYSCERGCLTTQIEDGGSK